MICLRCGEQIAKENREDFKPDSFRVLTGCNKFKRVYYKPGAIYECQNCGSEWEWIKGEKLHLLAAGVEMVQFDKPNYSQERMHEAFTFAFQMDGFSFDDDMEW